MNQQITADQLNDAGHLMIGGCDSIELAHEYGTPLVVYDVSQIRQQIRSFRRVFDANQVDYAVSYASKAFAAIAMYQVAAVEGAHVDVVSAGELYTATKADFPMERVSFHGNNKSREELEMAVDHHVGTIMIDNFHEIELLATVLEERDATVDVMLRITPESQLIQINTSKPGKLIASLASIFNLVKRMKHCKRFWLIRE